MVTDPPKTSDIILDRAVRGTDCQRCVDWAVGMLMAGHETDYLCRLAGQLAPFDMDAIAILRDRTLEELGFENLSDEALICCSVANSLQHCRDDELQMRRILESAKWLYVIRDMDDLAPLYLLCHGLNELEEYSQQWYVEGMDASNVHQIVGQTIDAFVKRYSKLP